MVEGVRIVEDPELERVFGGDLVAEIKGSLHPEGDCFSCKGLLGTDRPVRLDHQVEGVIGVVYARHAACRPLPESAGMILSLPQTYRTAMAAVPYGVEGAKNSEVMPIVIVNPSVDAWELVRSSEDGPWPSDLLEAFRNRGYVPVGGAQVGNPEPARTAKVSWGIDNQDQATVVDLLARWEITTGPTATDLLQGAKGLMLLVTYRHGVDQLGGPQGMVELLSDRDSVVSMWVPATT